MIIIGKQVIMVHENGGLKIMKKRPIVLCILDGYGLSNRIDGNAVKLANTPNIRLKLQECP